MAVTPHGHFDCVEDRELWEEGELGREETGAAEGVGAGGAGAAATTTTTATMAADGARGVDVAVDGRVDAAGRKSKILETFADGHGQEAEVLVLVRPASIRLDTPTLIEQLNRTRADDPYM